jgi:CRP/FNR family transcriptional regulator, cyclic AMP receptor protein
MTNPDARVDVMACLRATRLGTLPEPALARLVAASRVERFERETLLHPAHTPLDWLRLVVTGQIHIVARRQEGDEVSLADIGPGAWATWLACFMRSPTEHDFYSSADACFIAVPTALVRTLCDEHPAVYPLIIEEIGMRMRLLMAWTGQSVMAAPEQRMAKLICLLLQAQGPQGNGGALRTTQARLAKLARCSRQSANTLVNQLEARGLIRQAYGSIEIDDLRALWAFSEA